METYDVNLIEQLRAYQKAVNQADIDAVIALFHEDAGINDEGVQLLVRSFHEYDIGTQIQIILSDFTVEGDQVSCLCHTTNALDKALEYEGKPRKMRFTFRGERIASMIIAPSEVQEARRIHTISDQFFTWVRENYPEQWKIMSTVTSEGGRTLATLAQEWRTRRLSI